MNKKVPLLFLKFCFFHLKFVNPWDFLGQTVNPRGRCEGISQYLHGFIDIFTGYGLCGGFAKFHSALVPCNWIKNDRLHYWSCSWICASENLIFQIHILSMCLTLGAVQKIRNAMGVGGCKPFSLTPALRNSGGWVGLNSSALHNAHENMHWS